VIYICRDVDVVAKGDASGATHALVLANEDAPFLGADTSIGGDRIGRCDQIHASKMAPNGLLRDLTIVSDLLLALCLVLFVRHRLACQTRQ